MGHWFFTEKKKTGRCCCIRCHTCWADRLQLRVTLAPSLDNFLNCGFDGLALTGGVPPINHSSMSSRHGCIEELILAWRYFMIPTDLYQALWTILQLKGFHIKHTKFLKSIASLLEKCYDFYWDSGAYIKEKLRWFSCSCRPGVMCWSEEVFL